jgi:transposase
MANPRSKQKTARATPAQAEPFEPVVPITGGVDTHKNFHVAAAKDALGRDLGTRRFPATAAGYARLREWLERFGEIALVGVEGTGCYGAGLATHLQQHDITVVEVNRPNRQKRRRTGKSDTLDAIAAAHAAQSGEAHATPKPRTGPIESVRVLTETRDHLTAARTAAINVLKALLVTAPAGLRESLSGLTLTALLTHCAAFTPPAVPVKGSRGRARTQVLDQLATGLLDAQHALQTSLGELARTIRDYDTRLAELKTCVDTLVARIAPETSALHSVAGRAAYLLLTAGDSTHRIRSEPAFANLTGTAPLPCSSGDTQGPRRLSRAGDRQANSILYAIVITRLATHQPTRDYMNTRLRPGTKMTKKHLIRCLKRYAAREIYPRLMRDLANLHKHTTPTTTAA